MHAKRRQIVSDWVIICLSWQFANITEWKMPNIYFDTRDSMGHLCFVSIFNSQHIICCTGCYCCGNSFFNEPTEKKRNDEFDSHTLSYKEKSSHKIQQCWSIIVLWFCRVEGNSMEIFIWCSQLVAVDGKAQDLLMQNSTFLKNQSLSFNFQMRLLLCNHTAY